MTDDIIALAEEKVKQRAAEIAYNASDTAKTPEQQKVLYKTYRDLIILGARIFQEELLNLQGK